MVSCRKNIGLTQSWGAALDSKEDNLTWNSGNTDVATVEDGIVTGKQLGSTTITASYVDEDGNTISASCTVYVTVPDGVYYIKNVSYGKCLANDDVTVDSNSTHTEQKNTSTVTDPTQFWQITHLGSGWYGIRPIDRPLAVLAVSSGNVVVQDLAENATIPILYRWKIIQDSGSYVFLHRGLSSSAMTAEAAAAGSNVSLSVKSANPNCHWTLEEACGIVMWDTSTQRAITTAITKTVEMGDTVTLADLGISYEFYGTQRNITWTSSSSWTAHADSTTGAVTGIKAGFAVISGVARNGESDFYAHYAVEVWDNYVTQLVSDFGFTYEDALLIESVYSRICVAYPNDNSMMWAWRTARVLGGVIYNELKRGSLFWYEIAGVAYNGSESDYFTDVLGYTEEEYNRLHTTITNNYGMSSNADFAHMQITLSARLAYTLNKLFYY